MSAFSTFSTSLYDLPQNVTKRFTHDHGFNKNLSNGYVTCPESWVVSGCNITFDVAPSDGDIPIDIAELAFATLDLINQCVGQNGVDGGSAIFYSEEKPVQIIIAHETNNVTSIAGAHNNDTVSGSISSFGPITASTTFTTIPTGGSSNGDDICGRFRCIK